MKKKKYDFFVIGGGSAGVRAARIAASHGAKVGLAEARKLGGTCVNLGCIPKKLMLYASDFGLKPTESEAFGWNHDRAEFDIKQFMHNKDNEISRLNNIYKNILQENRVDLFPHPARFIDHTTLEINCEVIQAERILIATGGRPKHPEFQGGGLMATSDEALNLTPLPRHTVIHGGGYIALEFTRILSGLGSKVHLIHYNNKLLKSVDSDLSHHVIKTMEENDITISLKTKITACIKQERTYQIVLDTGETIETDFALAAIGRRPNTDFLDLDKANVKIDAQGYIITNSDNQSSTPNIYAVGDVTKTAHLAPMAIAEGHALADRLYGGMADRYVDRSYTPTVIFSMPPIGTIGLSEEEAKRQGITTDIYKSKFTPLKHKMSGRKEKTLMKLVVNQKTGIVIGCHMCGLDAPEIMQGFAAAMTAGATKADFDRTLAIHPTSAEEFVLMRQKS